MWGGFGDALTKAAALANQTIQELDREAGLADPETPATTVFPDEEEEDTWNEQHQEDGVEEGWNNDEDLHMDDTEGPEEKISDGQELPGNGESGAQQEQQNDNMNDPKEQHNDTLATSAPSMSTEKLVPNESIPIENKATSRELGQEKEDEVVDLLNGPGEMEDAMAEPPREDPVLSKVVDNDEAANHTAKNLDGIRDVNGDRVHGSPNEDLVAEVQLMNEQDPPQKPVTETNDNDVSPGNTHDAATVEPKNLPSEAFPSQPVDASLVQELKALLAEREGQLFSKTQQLSKLEELYAEEKQQLQNSHEKDLKKIKDEAKRRMQAMRERVEAADALTAQMEGLREEGAKMAQREADANEKAKRARSELKDMVEDFEATKEAEEKGRQRINELEVQLKQTHEDLSLARKGESQAGKLDSELRDARELSEKRAATILKLEQDVKSSKATIVELQAELKNTENHAAKETEEERKKLSQEKHDITLYWQDKLKQMEDEAEQRETKLQKSVEELRKSLTEAERRAHSSATEVESNTVPLLRKLEDAEARHRKRAAEWSESEAKLRQDLNQSTEKLAELQAEFTELQNAHFELDRTTTEYQDKISSLQSELSDEKEKVSALETTVNKLQEEIVRRKKDYERLEQSSNENTSRIRSELRRALHDAEETISTVRDQLESERRARQKLEEDAQNHSSNFPIEHRAVVAETPVPRATESFQKEDSAVHSFRQSEGQAEILAGALGGIIGDDTEEEIEEENYDGSNVIGQASMSILQQSEMAKRAVEIKELRTRLKALEDQNSKLLQTLGESRSAREELPEALRRLEELANDNEELRRENQALNEDLVDVRRTFQMTMDELISTPASGTQQNNVLDEP